MVIVHSGYYNTEHLITRHNKMALLKQYLPRLHYSHYKRLQHRFLVDSHLFCHQPTEISKKDDNHSW